MAKKKVEKKKGPKGKKARAAAKLDRQWGEHLDESAVQSAKYRRGKSRLTKKKHDRIEDDEPDEELTPMKGDLSAMGSEESDEEEDVPQESALHLLLTSIKKRSTRPKPSIDDQDGSLVQEESEDEGIEEEKGQEEETEESDMEMESTTDINGNGHLDQHIDPFSDHFNHSDIQHENWISERINRLQNFNKIPTPFLHDSLELQTSVPITHDQLKDSNLIDKNASASKSQILWNQRSTPLLACNRKILKDSWYKANKHVLKSDPCGHGSIQGASLSSLQSCIYPSLARYADILLTAESEKNRSAINNVLHLHLLNHVLTSRGRIQRNNKRIKEIEKNDETIDDTDKYRDQGYTRPTVLILLPTRGTCHSFFHDMMKLLGNSASQIENVDQFDEEYGPGTLEDDPNEDEAAKRRRQLVQDAKGAEWNGLFSDELNADDDFKVGFSLTPKVSGSDGVAVKMFTNFYRSDIIMASPLALKFAMETEDEDGTTDSDFLSSIEICLVARADVLYMQNLDHVNHVLEALNQQPKKNNGTDFGRVRQYLLAGHAAHWRQTIVTSAFSAPMILAIFKRNAKSVEGALKLRHRVTVDEASLNDVIVRAKQVFQRIPCNSFPSQGNDLLKYFEEQVLPQILQSKQKHTMVFIPSYFDFVSVRNMLLKKEADFVSVTEYARVSEISRGRARFLQGRKPLMLYTGRAHYFSRHAIKGVRHLIFFGLPERADFYSGLINELNKGLDRDGGDDLHAPSSVLALFSKYEAHSLERIVGKQHCDRMIKGEKQTYMFVS